MIDHAFKERVAPMVDEFGKKLEEAAEEYLERWMNEHFSASMREKLGRPKIHMNIEVKPVIVWERAFPS